MCVPCAAPAMPLIGWLLLIVALILASLGWALWKAAPYVGLTLGAVAVAAYRWFSGAVLTKPVDMTDQDYWDMRLRQGRPGPRFTRPVRATARVSLVAVSLGLLTHWVATVLVLGTLTALVSGGAMYARRDRIVTTARALPRQARRTLTGQSPALEGEPIRVKARVGSPR